MPVFALFPERKSVFYLGSLGSIEDDNELVRRLRNIPTEKNVVFGNFTNIELALSVSVWINNGAWIDA